MLDRFIRFFTSMKLTVVCLGLAAILVFLGTLAQTSEGLYQAQARYFRSFIVWWSPHGSDWKLPVLPGGYLVGAVLVLNLIVAQIQQFRLTWDKLGIHLTHIGLILLLLGQLATDLFSRETLLHFREGEAKNYSESGGKSELVFITDADQSDQDRVVAIPAVLLTQQSVVRHEQLPFAIRVKEFYPNSRLRDRAPMVDTNPPPATQGIGPRVTLLPQSVTRKTDERNIPTAVVELIGSQETLGTWLVSPFLVNPQEVTIDGRTWRMSLRWQRHYTPYSIQLLETTHEVYPGTDIPKNFQSRVRIENPVSGENREVDIYMNNPLRYHGLTYYQYQMGRDDMDRNVGTSTLQVVRNPSWLTPYLGCILVGIGLTYQFMFHLFSFLRTRRVP